MNGANHDSSGEDADDFNLDYFEMLFSMNSKIDGIKEIPIKTSVADWNDVVMGPGVGFGTVRIPGEDSFYVFRGHTDEVYSVACSPIDDYLVATGGKDNKGFLWKFGSQDSKLELQGHEDTISTLAFSRDGKYLASGSFDGLIKVWDAKLGVIKCTLEGSGGGVEWLKWHPRRYLILAGSTDCSVKLWDANKSSHLRTFNGHTSGITCGDFSHDGKIICTGSNDASLRIWNTKTTESINVRGHGYHTGGLTCLSINIDSTIALTGSNDCTARTVNLSSGKVINSMVSHSDSVVCCGFARNCRSTFATGSLDSKLIVWDTLCPGPISISEHKTGERAEGVTCLLWLSAVRCIVTGSTYGKVRLWDFAMGTCSRTYDGHQGEIVSLSVTKHQTHIVSVSSDGTARVFKVLE